MVGEKEEGGGRVTVLLLLSQGMPSLSQSNFFKMNFFGILISASNPSFDMSKYFFLFLQFYNFFTIRVAPMIKGGKLLMCTTKIGPSLETKIGLNSAR